MRIAAYTFYAELRKCWKMYWHYRLDAVASIFSIAFFFVGLSFLMGGGKLNPNAMQANLIGFLVWYFLTTVTSDMSYYINQEAQSGTLEQTAMSVMPSWFWILSRAISMVIFSFLMVAITGATLALVLGIRFPITFSGFISALILIVGILGFGFIITSLGILYKRVSAVTGMFDTLLFILSGSMLPIEHLPSWMQSVSKILPTTQGIIVLKQTLLENFSLSESWANGDLKFLVMHSLTYFFVGLLFFIVAEKVAKNRGTLGHY